jgi:hypothetical protein
VNRFFVNGVQVGTADFTPANNGRVHLCVQPGNGEWYLGHVDELRFSTFTAGPFDPSYLFYNVYHPTLSITTSSGSISVSWPGGAGTLQQATNVAGPYQDISGATSPYTNQVVGQAKFFRLKQ